MRKRTCSRKGVTVVECAVIYPATFMLLLGLVVGGMGVFRYQEMASLARAGSRYASTHGGQYRKDAGLEIGTAGTTSELQDGYYWATINATAASGSDTSWAGQIYDNAIRPNLVALDPSNLTVKIGWPSVVNLPKPDNWPGSRVTVMISYRWLPEVFVVGPISLTSTSTVPITN